MTDNGKVSVGVTTYAGYSGTLAGVILAVYAYANGDHTAGTVGTIAAAVAFALTQVFRYVQAVVLAKQARSGLVVQNNTTSAGSPSQFTAENQQILDEIIARGPLTVDEMTARGPVKIPDPGAGATVVGSSMHWGSPASVAAEEAELPSDDEELENVPPLESAKVPVPPAGEPPSGQGEMPPLQPGDTTEA